MAEQEHNARPWAGTYRAYGLTIASCLHCSELLPGTGTPQVIVEYGPVSRIVSGTTSNGVTYQGIPGTLLLEVDRVGRFQISNGNKIVIERHPEASDDDLRLFLLGSALGALMHQRG